MGCGAVGVTRPPERHSWSAPAGSRPSRRCAAGVSGRAAATGGRMAGVRRGMLLPACHRTARYVAFVLSFNRCERRHPGLRRPCVSLLPSRCSSRAPPIGWWRRRHALLAPSREPIRVGGGARYRSAVLGGLGSRQLAVARSANWHIPLRTLTGPLAAAVSRGARASRSTGTPSTIVTLRSAAALVSQRRSWYQRCIVRTLGGRATRRRCLDRSSAITARGSSPARKRASASSRTDGQEYDPGRAGACRRGAPPGGRSGRRSVASSGSRAPTTGAAASARSPGRRAPAGTRRTRGRRRATRRPRSPGRRPESGPACGRRRSRRAPPWSPSLAPCRASQPGPSHQHAARTRAKPVLRCRRSSTNRRKLPIPGVGS